MNRTHFVMRFALIRAHLKKKKKINVYIFLDSQVNYS
jgi:hypothetical protein